MSYEIAVLELNPLDHILLTGFVLFTKKNSFQ